MTLYLASMELIYLEPETKRWNVETLKQIKTPFSASTPSIFAEKEENTFGASAGRGHVELFRQHFPPTPPRNSMQGTLHRATIKWGFKRRPSKPTKSIKKK